MTTTTRPLVVWANFVVCPRCDHDLYVITDGTHFALSLGHMDATLAPERDGTVITWSCVQPHPDLYERCGHTLTVDLAREEWTAWGKTIDLLVAESYPVYLVTP